MKIATYLGFGGNCRDAFAFYQDVLGGEITAMFAHKDVLSAGDYDPDWADKIMHARLDVGDQSLMGGDGAPGTNGTPQGFSVSLHLESDSEANRIFERLSTDGTVLMPIAQTEWASRFGMCTDKYGTPWIINSTNGAS